MFVTILEYINNISSHINIFTFVLAKPALIIVFIYYVILYLSFYYKKYLIVFIMFVIIHKNIVYFSNDLNILVMDVSQGDSIIIKFPYSDKVILIDTGGMVTYPKDEWQIRKSNYSIALSKTIPYLKSIGVSKIDYLITTHGDYDHIGESINLVNHFKINNVIFNKGEYNDLEELLMKELKKKNINYYQSKDKLVMDGYVFNFLNQKIYDNDENKNSNIIYFKYNQYKFLFMGDATCENEEELINHYNLINITFLKVGHHGSDTSSCKDFINAIQPKISLISVGLNNRYHHPKEEVLNNLSNSNIYRTDLMGSIRIDVNNRYKISTFEP